MQQAIPYGNGRAWPSEVDLTSSDAPEFGESSKGVGEIKRAVEENPVVVVGRRGCCMVHVVRKLLLGQGVNPVVCEVGEDADEAALMAGLQEAGAGDSGLAQAKASGAGLPAVFVGGRLVGGLDRLMAVHIAGELVPILKQAGALWL
ncbi:monothiol glutaredoxin-S3-like [Musa acuminata AAA Group]|uniref:monothiol glutaredoxin-S3-like n=1 Tax=Musa acuminata AAA Group TaxID=214697 RepID=UPI0031CFE1F5